MKISRCLALKNIKEDFEFNLYIPEGPTWEVAIDAMYELVKQMHALAANATKANTTPETTLVSEKTDEEALS